VTSAAISYTWFKDTIFNLVRPSVKWYIFDSSDGTLYFQSVTRDDVGEYYCMVMRPDSRDNFHGGKVSEPIPLHVTESGKLSSLPFANVGYVTKSVSLCACTFLSKYGRYAIYYYLHDKSISLW